MHAITRALVILPIQPAIAAFASTKSSTPNPFKEQLAVLRENGAIVRRQE